MKKNSKVFVLFSGFNERAVIALCRFFNDRELPFIIIASSCNDQIISTEWASKVFFYRQSNVVDNGLFEKVREFAPLDVKLIYCPTTEFINKFVLQNRKYLEKLNYVINLAPKEVYERVTSKQLSIELVKGISELVEPAELSLDNLSLPCVIKPKLNVKNGSVYYPKLCFTSDDIKLALSGIIVDECFAQEYIEGQSYYLCGYLDRYGNYKSYWQINYAQQPEGKSMVLASTCDNPGINENRFFEGLAKCNYSGPIMMELLKKDNKFYYIEINPRFWGPLQLAVDSTPEVLELFVRDADYPLKVKTYRKELTPVYWYSWEGGAKDGNYHLYPIAESCSELDIKELLKKHDVYAMRDA